MREILFRAKRRADYGDPTEWQFGVPFKDGDGDWIMKDSCAERVIQNDTLGQFTGLTDKNGVKIFEGDIVSLGGVNYPVIFNTLGRCAEFALTDGVPFGFDYVHVPMEVVGNIYDTPELIGGADDESHTL